MSVVYIYLNDTDFSGIIQFLSRQGFLPDEAPHIQKPCTFGPITYSPCSGRYLQPGFFCAPGNELRSLKKYIKEHFAISKDKTYYIGPGIYDEWYRGEHVLPVLFNYEEVLIPSSQMPQLLEELSAEGFQFRFSNTKTRNIRNFEFPCEEFIIYSKEDRLKYLIHNKTTVNYVYGSECVFVYKSEGEDSYRFIFDMRLLRNKDTDIAAIFRFIKGD